MFLTKRGISPSRYIFLIYLYLLFSCEPISAQDHFELRGKVVDMHNDAPLQNVTISLYSFPDSVLLKKVVS